MPQANNMGAKHCARQTIILDFLLKRYLEGLFDGFSCQNKDPRFNLRRNYTLNSEAKKSDKLFQCINIQCLEFKWLFYFQNPMAQIYLHTRGSITVELPHSAIDSDQCWGQGLKLKHFHHRPGNVPKNILNRPESSRIFPINIFYILSCYT